MCEQKYIFENTSFFRRDRAYLDDVCGDETDTSSPALGRVVEHVVDSEAGILASELVQVLPEEDVILVDVCEDQVDLGLVAGGAASHDSLGDLQHGSDTGATGDHAKAFNHVGSVDHGTLGTLDLHGVANVQSCEVTADVAGGVALDEQVEVSGVDIGGDRGVRADDLFVAHGLGLGVLHVEVGGE